LQADGGPLAGLGATFEHTPYDWNDPAVLRACLEAIGDMGVVMAGSSEGGLFEYPADDMIVANLDVLRDATPADFFMAGPVIRDATTLDPRLRATVGLPGQPAVRYLGLEKFGTLAARAGWTIARHLDGPMHQVVRLQKA
jgi:hypothetical protein